MTVVFTTPLVVKKTKLFFINYTQQIISDTSLERFHNLENSICGCVKQFYNPVDAGGGGGTFLQIKYTLTFRVTSMGRCVRLMSTMALIEQDPFA